MAIDAYGFPDNYNRGECVVGATPIDAVRPVSFNGLKQHSNIATWGLPTPPSGIAFSMSRFIAICPNASVILVSTDGFEWLPEPFVSDTGMMTGARLFTDPVTGGLLMLPYDANVNASASTLAATSVDGGRNWVQVTLASGTWGSAAGYNGNWVIGAVTSNNAYKFNMTSRALTTFTPGSASGVLAVGTVDGETFRLGYNVASAVIGRYTYSTGAIDSTTDTITSGIWAAFGVGQPISDGTGGYSAPQIVAFANNLATNGVATIATTGAWTIISTATSHVAKQAVATPFGLLVTAVGSSVFKLLHRHVSAVYDMTSISTGSNNWQDGAYGNGIAVFIQRDNYRTITTTNGIRWRQGTCGSGTWTACEIGNDYTVLLCNNGIAARSYVWYKRGDQPWQKSYLPINTEWNSVSYGKGKFWFSGTYAIYATEDFESWGRNLNPLFASGDYSFANPMTTLVFANGVLIASGLAQSSVMFISPDYGDSWFAAATPAAVGWEVASAFGAFWATNSTGTNSAIASSSDGITWNTALTLPQASSAHRICAVEGNATTDTYYSGKYLQSTVVTKAIGTTESVATNGTGTVSAGYYAFAAQGTSGNTTSCDLISGGRGVWCHGSTVANLILLYNHYQNPVVFTTNAYAANDDMKIIGGGSTQPYLIVKEAGTANFKVWSISHSSGVPTLTAVTNNPLPASLTSCTIFGNKPGAATKVLFVGTNDAYYTTDFLNFTQVSVGYFGAKWCGCEDDKGRLILMNGSLTHPAVLRSVGSDWTNLGQINHSAGSLPPLLGAWGEGGVTPAGFMFSQAATSLIGFLCGDANSPATRFSTVTGTTNKIAYGNGHYLIGPGTSSTTLKRSEGENFRKTAASNAMTSSGWFTPCFGNGVFVVAYATVSNVSIDGRNWAAGVIPLSIQRNGFGNGWHYGYLDGTPVNWNFAVSDKGRTWQLVTVPVPSNLPFYAGVATKRRMAMANNRLVSTLDTGAILTANLGAVY